MKALTQSGDLETSTRLTSLDVWRGLIVVVMALDHANSFIARGKYDLELWTTQFPDYGTDWVAFLTRWITHLAAPGFLFLMGVGAILFASSRTQAGWSQLRISLHLMVRGAILILLQFTIENAAWAFGNAGPGRTYFGVLFALGASLIAIAALRLLNKWVLLSAGITLVTAIELLLPEASATWVEYEPWQLLLLWPGLGESMFVLYPILPWLGVGLIGSAFGTWLRDKPIRAQSWMLPIGAASLAGFAAIRFGASYGNIIESGEGALPFLNVVKYPPSVTFLLLTLGGGLLIAGLAWRFDWHPRVLVIFGSVPLFFYVTHLWLYAAMGQIVDPAGIGLTPAFYLLWLLGLAILLPACSWYGRFKASQPFDSVWRMF